MRAVSFPTRSPPSLTHTHSKLTHTITHARTHARTLSLSLSHAHTHTLSLSLSLTLSLSLSLSLSHTHSLSRTLTHTLSLSFSFSLTHSLAHTHTLSRSLTHSLTHTHSRPGLNVCVLPHPHTHIVQTQFHDNRHARNAAHTCSVSRAVCLFVLVLPRLFVHPLVLTDGVRGRAC